MLETGQYSVPRRFLRRQHVAVAGRMTKRFVARLISDVSIPCLLLGLLFFAASLTPSLIPRGAVEHAFWAVWSRGSVISPARLLRSCGRPQTCHDYRAGRRRH